MNITNMYRTPKWKKLLNRVLLTIDFFRGTNVTGQIWRATYQFDYVNGDSSANDKGAYGLYGEGWLDVWKAAGEKLRAERPPMPNPGSAPAGQGSDPRIPVVGSHPARARALGRADRDDDRERRTTAEILDYFELNRGDLPPQTHERASAELRAAYDAAYDLPPGQVLVIGSIVKN